MSAQAFAERSLPLQREGASPQLLTATAAVSAFAAWAIPGHRLGLAAVLVAFGVAALVAAARSIPLRVETIGYAGAALALASMAAVRSAAWVVAVDGMAAGALATLAVFGGRTWDDLVHAPIAVTSRAMEAAPFLTRGAGRLTAGRGFSPALRGAVLGVVLVAVFGALFVSADRVFADLAHDFLLPEIDLSLLPARAAVFVAMALASTGLVITGARFAHLGPPRLLGAVQTAALGEQEGRRPRPGLSPVEWIIPLGLLDLLFAAFVWVQFTYLFGGRAHVIRTTGLTYAEYARQGFFQLVAVAALSLVVVALASRWARRRQPRDYWILGVLLGLLMALNLVVLASALKRLALYEQIYGFTRLRISVHAVILWLAGVLLLVLIAGAIRRGAWLPRAVVAFSAAALLLFNLVNPDGFVAARNVQRYFAADFAADRIDVSYLAGLSADAVPALTALPGPQRACALEPHLELFEEPDSWPAWNLARARARAELERTPPAPCFP
jgi:hypothetical protein